MKHLREFIPRTLSRLYNPQGFRGAVFTLLSGTGIALSIAYITQPILTRLYAPEAFGVSDYFGMLLTVFLTVSSLRYEDAVMTPEDANEARAILRLAMWFTAGWTMVLVLAVFWSDEICTALGVAGLAPWLWLLPVTLFLSKGARLLEVWLSRMKYFRSISIGQVASTSAIAGSRIAAAAVTPAFGAGGLIGGVTVGHAVSAAIYAPIAIRHRRVVGREDGEKVGLRWVAGRYKRYAIYSMPAAFLNSVVARLPVIVLPFFFSIGIVGLYGRAFVALAVPLGLIGTAVSQVFFVHAGEATRAGNLAQLASDVHRRLVMAGLFPTLAVMAAGPELFEIVFGSEWREAGVYLRLIAPWLFLSAITAPLTRIFDVLERQRADLLTSVFMFVLLCAALVAGGSSGKIGLTLLVLGATGLFVRTVHLGTVLRLAGVRPRDMIAPYLRFTLLAAPPAIMVGAASILLGPFAALMSTALAALIYYGTAAWKEGILGHFGRPA